MAETKIACLPMYDWPQVRAETDALWTAIAERLRALGIAAPPALDREIDRQRAWVSPDLALGQTCGLPFMQDLRGRAALLGSPVYDLADCAPGDYCSALVARADDTARSPADFRGRRVAFSARESQSGYGVLLHVFAPLAAGEGFFAEAVRSGGHPASIEAVAEGRADLAAIDAVTWELALEHLPAARDLKVIARSPPTPGLPYITSLDLAGRRDEVNAAIGDAIDGLDAATRRALHLVGYRPRDEADYRIIATRMADAAAAGYAELN